ncbi:MAG: DUF2095 family protein [Candidatus Thorarchaeota archaeon]|nr:DUF2095 family protein [Candidatus Thorarchaeota archaeon]
MSEDGEFREVFPSLNKELEENTVQTFKIDGVRTMAEETDSKADAKTFTPDVIDYIRRCDTVSQAFEIVDFLMKQNEINQAQAREIKSQIKADGLRSFGAKKEKDHYLHHGIGEE